MSIPTFEQIDAQIKEVMGPGFAEVREAARFIDRNRLREITPTSWITCPKQREESRRERA